MFAAATSRDVGRTPIHDLPWIYAAFRKVNGQRHAAVREFALAARPCVNLGAKDQDQALMAAIARGDKTALRRLYLAHAPALHGFVSRFTLYGGEIDDVVQDTFLAIWRNAGKYQGRSRLKTWMFSIARNKALDRMRRLKRETPLPPDFDAPDPQAPNPEKLIESAQNVDRLRACIEGLNPQLNRAVRLAFFEEFSYRDIAEIENIPEGTVKTRILRAKHLLMRCMGAIKA